MNKDFASSPLLVLLDTPTRADLGPKKRSDSWSIDRIEEELTKIPEFAALPSAAAKAVKSLLLLWHDHLDASHEISQSLHDDNGSYIHGMMHRREPDYFNAKYWFRRVPKHPAFEGFTQLLQQKIAAPASEASALIKKSEWDPFQFVDLCEKAETSSLGELQKTVREIQRLEFEAMLGFVVSGSK